VVAALAALLGALALGPVGCFASASPITEDAQGDASSGGAADAMVDRKNDDASNDHVTKDVTVATDGGNDVDVASDGGGDAGAAGDNGCGFGFGDDGGCDAGDGGICIVACDSTHPCLAREVCCQPLVPVDGPQCGLCSAVCP
jgi:hypothetical protein